jgi:ATP-binding cassette subfamily F protein uup
MINGQKKHVLGFLQEFLFSPDRAHTLASFLSGGERNRLLLAKIMSKPANVLVLDEPTNDLDAETLELLEDLLPQFSGTVFLVSHDRAFLNNVATSTIVFEGNAQVGEYDGGYDDWLRFRDQRSAAAIATAPRSSSATPAAPSNTASAAPATATAPATAPTPAAARTKRLSFRDQRELDALPDRIAELESRQKELEQQLAAPGFFQSGSAKITEVTTELSRIAEELAHCFQRWEALEST